MSKAEGRGRVLERRVLERLGGSGRNPGRRSAGSQRRRKTPPPLSWVADTESISLVSGRSIGDCLNTRYVPRVFKLTSTYEVEQHLYLLVRYRVIDGRDHSEYLV